MYRSVLFAILLLLTSAPALAVTPRPEGGDPRIQFVTYDPFQVVELEGRPATSAHCGV